MHTPSKCMRRVPGRRIDCSLAFPYMPPLVIGSCSSEAPLPSDPRGPPPPCPCLTVNGICRRIATIIAWGQRARTASAYCLCLVLFLQRLWYADGWMYCRDRASEQAFVIDGGSSCCVLDIRVHRPYSIEQKSSPCSSSGTDVPGHAVNRNCTFVCLFDVCPHQLSQRLW